MNYLKLNYSLNNVTATIQTDMSSAFDIVDHDILISKLEHYRIRDKELSLMSSFLSDREQFVEIDGIRSDTLPSIPCSVIQGSKLSSLLYTIYINEVPLLYKNMNSANFKLISLREQFQIYGQNISHFAINYIDNTSNSISCNNILHLQNYINDFFTIVEKFYNANKLTLNSDKSRLLVSCKGIYRKESNNIILVTCKEIIA